MSPLAWGRYDCMIKVMPCYLFTYHAYRSWMPDRPRGFVRRGKGILPPDKKLAYQYEKNATETPVQFQQEQQHALIRRALTACSDHLSARCHGISTDSTHIHILMSWKSQRSWKSMRSSIKSALSRQLNTQFGRRTWFAESASRKQVRDREHFDYLMLKYLPNHRGQQWYEGQPNP